MNEQPERQCCPSKKTRRGKPCDFRALYFSLTLPKFPQYIPATARRFPSRGSFFLYLAHDRIRRRKSDARAGVCSAVPLDLLSDDHATS